LNKKFKHSYLIAQGMVKIFWIIFHSTLLLCIQRKIHCFYNKFPPFSHRFWETDLRTVRKTNRSTMRHPRSRSSMAGGPGGHGGMGTVRGMDKFSGWVCGAHIHFPWRWGEKNSLGTRRPWNNSHISHILYNSVFVE